MSLPASALHDVHVLFQTYVKHKTSGNDIAEKLKEIVRIQSLITDAVRSNAKTHKWIEIILEMGKIADKAQRQGTYCSQFTETLYVVMHRIQRELNPEEIMTAISSRKAEFATIKLEYIAAKKNNQKSESILEIQQRMDNKLYELIHLGELDSLLQLGIDDIKNLFPGSVKGPSPFPLLSKWAGGTGEEIKGYEYSDAGTIYGVDNVNSYVPLVVQEYVRIYSGKYTYLELKRPETKDQDKEIVSDRHPLNRPHLVSQEHKESDAAPQSRRASLKERIKLTTGRVYEAKEPERKNVISSDFILELTAALDSYTLGKTHGFDLANKIKECDDIKTLLDNYGTINASPSEWLDLVTHIGEQADRIQKSGTTCSGCAEVFYYIMHRLSQEINKNDSKAFIAKCADEHAELKLLESQAVTAKVGNQDRIIIQKLESQIIDGIKYLAYLGDLDPLLSLKQSKIEELFYGTYNDTVISSGISYVTGASNLGYEFDRTPNPHGAPGPFCTSLPVALQRKYPEAYLKKYEARLKAVVDEKNAIESAGKAIRELETEIAKLNNSPFARQLIANHEKDEKALLNANLTFQAIQTNIIDRLDEIRLKIITTTNYIQQTMGSRKEELTLKLQKQTVELEQLKTALAKVVATFRNAQLERDRIKEDSQRVAERNVVIAMTALSENMSKLATDPVHRKVLNTQKKDIKTIEENKLTLTDAKALSTQASTLDSDITKIKALIATSPLTRAAVFNQELTSHIEKLTQFKSAASELSTTLDTARLTHELETKTAESRTHLSPLAKNTSTDSFAELKEMTGLSATGTVLTRLQQQSPSNALLMTTVQDEVLVETSPKAKLSSAKSDDGFVLASPKSPESKTIIPKGEDARRQLFEQVAKLGNKTIKPREMAKKVKGFQAEFNRDPSMINRLLEQLKSAGEPVHPEVESSFTLSA